jgi:glycosyltransferase involved in cell wall biosynthesis
MRILYVSQYFPPEMGAPASRVHELSRAWVQRGHSVTVLTGFAHHPTGRKAPADRGVLSRRDRIDGIDVIRTYVYATANQGVARRMLSYASFMLSAMTIGRLRVPRPDIVIATSPQLLCGAAGYFLARTLGVPFVFEVRDLWPESILAVEAMKPNPVIRTLQRVARFLYQHCDRLVTVGEGYRRGICRGYGIAADKLAVIPNGIDTRLFVPLPRNNEVRRQFGWGDRFVTMYIGTHGLAHGLQQVLEAARLLRETPELLFVFVGEGAEKAALQRLAETWRLGNVQFIGQQSKARVPLFYAACDLGLVTLREAPLFQEVLPSKIFEYLGMERPIVLNVSGDARQIVENAGAGVYVPSGDVRALAGTIQMLSHETGRLRAMGQAGRQFVLKHYDRARQARQYLEVLQTCVQESGSSLLYDSAGRAHHAKAA